jgi:hypothetical protein
MPGARQLQPFSAWHGIAQGTPVQPLEARRDVMGHVRRKAGLADADRRPTRGMRPRTAAELAFLGPTAETFLRTAGAAGTLRLEHEPAAIVELVPVWTREAVITALGRATRFRRFKPATGAPSWKPGEVCRPRFEPANSCGWSCPKCRSARWRRMPCGR